MDMRQKIHFLYQISLENGKRSIFGEIFFFVKNTDELKFLL